MNGREGFNPLSRHSCSSYSNYTLPYSPKWNKELLTLPSDPLPLHPLETGTSIQELATFIKDFYSSSQSTSSTSTSTSSANTLPPPQQVDDDFLRFIWNTLVEQADVRVGVLTNIPSPPTHDSHSGEDQEEEEEEKAIIEEKGEEEEEESDLKPLKKPRRKPPVPAPSLPTHELSLLPSSVSSLPYSQLLLQYPPSLVELRVIASKETAWCAITGSHSKPSSITRMVWTILQMVSRGRGEGVTAVRLSRELGIDPKSIFHYIKVPQQLGIVYVFFFSPPFLTHVDEGCERGGGD